MVPRRIPLYINLKTVTKPIPRETGSVEPPFSSRASVSIWVPRKRPSQEAPLSSSTQSRIPCSSWASTTWAPRGARTSLMPRTRSRVRRSAWFSPLTRAMRAYTYCWRRSRHNGGSRGRCEISLPYLVASIVSKITREGLAMIGKRSGRCLNSEDMTYRT